MKYSDNLIINVTCRTDGRYLIVTSELLLKKNDPAIAVRTTKISLKRIVKALEKHNIEVRRT